MKIKEMLLLSLSMASLVACTNSANNVTNNEDRDAMQILEEKREYYEELDKIGYIMFITMKMIFMNIPRI